MKKGKADKNAEYLAQIRLAINGEVLADGFFPTEKAADEWIADFIEEKRRSAYSVNQYRAVVLRRVFYSAKTPMLYTVLREIVPQEVVLR